MDFIFLLSLTIGLASCYHGNTIGSFSDEGPLQTTCSTFKSCPPWHYCGHEGECQAGELPPDGSIEISNGNTMVLDDRCVTYNEEEHVMEVGFCIYSAIDKNENPHQVYCELHKNISTLNEDMCGVEFNRDGTLCGKCKDGYYPLAYSFDMNCVQCPNARSNWWKFVLAAFLPLTIFYFTILLLKINITSSHFFGSVYVIQHLIQPGLVRLAILTYRNPPSFLLAIRILATVCGVWNLDFLRSMNLEICLDMNTLQTMALEVCSGFYPFLLMIISWLLMSLHDNNFRLLVFILKPFRTITKYWDVRTSTIDVFATFFLMSNVKFLSITYDLLAPVKVYQLHSDGNSTYRWGLYYDATIDYFGSRHLPYAIVAIITFLTFTLLPVLLLLFYPFRWFQRFLNLFPFRWYILHTFVDAFQGCYKDGTEEGTRDYRWFTSLFFVMRFFFFLTAGYTASVSYFPLAAMLVTFVLILLIALQPFKENKRHYSTIISFFLLSLIVTLVSVVAIKLADLLNPTFKPIGTIGSFFLVISLFILLSHMPAMGIWFVLRKCWNRILLQRRGYVPL